MMQDYTPTPTSSEASEPSTDNNNSPRKDSPTLAPSPFITLAEIYERARVRGAMQSTGSATPDTPTRAQRDAATNDGHDDRDKTPGDAPKAPRPAFRALSPPSAEAIARTEAMAARQQARRPSNAPRWLTRASCTHTTMTRLYNDRLTCDNCHQTSKSGWVYICTQDKEIEMAHDIAQGEQLHFDELGEELTKLVKSPVRGPENRTRPFELLNELTPEALHQYTPEQLKFLLEQREKVKTTSFEDAKKATAKAAAQGSVQSMLQTLLENKNNDRPWVLPSNQQCNYKVCGTCRYTFSDRSFLSIDGILKGDIPPTAATGFGFHQLGERPVADANIVKSIGWRPVPWPGAKKEKEESPAPSTPSLMSLLDILDEQFATHDKNDISIQTDASAASEASINSWDEPHEQAQIIAGAGQSAAGIAPMRPPPGFPPPVPGLYPGYASIAPPAASRLGVRVGTSSEGHVIQPLRAADLLIRPPWTPPPTPECWKAQPVDSKNVEFVFHPTVHDGRSPSSLKTNPQVRDTVFSSHMPPELYRPMWQDGSQDSNSSTIPSTSAVQSTSHGYSSSSFTDPDDDTRHNIPYIPEEACDVGLFLPFNQVVFNQARATPLPPPTPAEVRFFFAGSLRDRNPEHAKDWEQMPQLPSLNMGLVAGVGVGAADVGMASGERARMEILEEEEGSRGATLTEEAAEMGTADVLTQV